ncbi:MAG: hypothetical protein HY611_02090 [Elusimicrobia bacterium]|nr:hypothetical protein [Elusimicrobiota bacterium]
MTRFEICERRPAAALAVFLLACSLGAGALRAADPEQESHAASLFFDGASALGAGEAPAVRAAAQDLTLAKAVEASSMKQDSQSGKQETPSAPAPQRKGFFTVWHDTWDDDMEEFDRWSDPVMEVLDEPIRKAYVPLMTAGGAAAAPFIVGASGALPLFLAVGAGVLCGFAAAFVLPFVLKYAALWVGWFAGLFHGGAKAVASRFEKPTRKPKIPIVVM